MMPAAKIIGIDSKKENRAAAFRVNPKAKPAVIVTPEREVPGISAMACAHPIKKACVLVILLTNYMDYGDKR